MGCQVHLDLRWLNEPEVQIEKNKIVSYEVCSYLIRWRRTRVQALVLRSLKLLLSQFQR